MSDETPLLEVNGLKKYYDSQTSMLDSILRRSGGDIQAVDDVSLEIEKEDSIAIIGESGCGKTTLLFALMGLTDPTDGEMIYKGKKSSEFSRADWKRYRRNVQIIFQDPFNSLDPKLTVAESLKEPLKIHNIDGNHDEAVHDILEKVQLDPPEKYAHRFPDNLSGGEKQRVAIARALILDPDLILADEPVSMLDVSTQAAIISLLERLVDELEVSLVYISHDLSTVSYVAESINVMYLGRIVESASTDQILNDPKHPYSKALTQAIPIPDPHHERERTSMSGSPKEPVDLGDGCRFRDRCPERMDICEKTPEYVETDPDHFVACHLYYEHGNLENEVQQRQ